ncbi:hypothetical protein ABNN70_00190 [Sporolactobacillus sp. Y61]|uniref:MFS transporter n=1 Tax=Sporolactobacillus sp. Y61 TaxID=3160863 RepID=A0AAU8IFL4_9BACL
MAGKTASHINNDARPLTDTFKTLISIRNYRLLISGQLVSLLGDGVQILSLVWTMKVLTGSSVQMAFVLVADTIPMIIFGIFSGVIIDRGNQIIPRTNRRMTKRG